MLADAFNTMIDQSKQLDQELRRSETRFRGIFDSVAVGCIVIDSTGHIELFNNAAQKMFGYASEEVVGNNVRMLMPEPYLSEYNLHNQRFKDFDEPGSIGIGREVRGLRRDGESFPMHLGVSKMEIGGQSSLIGSATDLTEMKSIEKQLLRSVKMEAVGHLTGSFAHDFNNILAIILGNVELLGMQAHADEKTTRWVSAIRIAAQRAAALTRRLLSFSSRHAAKSTRVNINELMLKIDDIIVHAATPDVLMERHFAEDLWSAAIDPGDFEDILINLIVNAREAMDGHGSLTLKTNNIVLDEQHCERNGGCAPGEYVQLAVSDTGGGIPSEHMKDLFDPFFTTKETTGGAGLGLAMVYDFCQRSRGHIKVDSEQGTGTTFRLYLPRLDGPEQPEQA